MEVVRPETTRNLPYSRTACLGCRSQKIRCSRDIPSCSRCARRRFSCTYPGPANRRLIAASKRRRLFNNDDDDGNLITTSDTPQDVEVIPLVEPKDTGYTFFTSSPTQDFHRINVARDMNFTQDEEVIITSPQRVSDKLPELEIGLLLIEVYFSRIWTAALLFDHMTFIEDYRSHKVPEHVLRSIFAVASLFFRDPPPGSIAKENGLAAFSSIRERGRMWAETGSQLVLMRADVPSVSNIQACEVLCLYWFALGELDRCSMHFSISRESRRILEQKAIRMEARKRGSSASLKMPKRLGWACSIKSCIMEMDNQSMDASPLERGDISDPSAVPLSQRDAADWLTWEETNFQSSAAYIVELFKFWKRIKSFVARTSSYTNESAFLTAFFELDSKLQEFYSSLPSQFKSTIPIRTSTSERFQLNVFFVHSVYYLCVMCLHASAVPALSCSKTGFQISHEIVKLSAGTVYSNSRRFVEMAREYLSTTPDFTKVPSFVGYCAFVAGSAQECVLEFQTVRNGHDLPDDVEICLIVLRELVGYWPVLKFFEQDLERRFQRLNPNFHLPSKSSAQKLVDSPRPLSIDESNPPELTALINAPLEDASNPSTSFILRQYQNPNANRQGDDEAEDMGHVSEEEVLVPDSSTHTEAPVKSQRQASSNDGSTSRSTESSPNKSSGLHDIPIYDLSDPSPVDDFNISNAEGDASSLDGKFPDLNTPGEHIWGLWDMLPDNLGELFSGQPDEYAQDWTESW